MKILRNFFKKSQIGLDLGVHSIRTVGLEKSGKEIYLSHAFFQTVSKQERASGVFTAIMQSHNINSQPIISTVLDDKCNFFEIQLPSMPAKEIRGAIANEISRLTGLADTEFFFAYKADKQYESGEKSYLVRFINKDEHFSKTNFFNEVDTPSGGTIPESQALLNCLIWNNYLKEENAYICVDIGDSKVLVSLIHKNKVSLTNTIYVGINNIYSSLSENTSLTIDEINNLLGSCDLSKLTEDTENEQEKLIYLSLIKILEPIQETVQYFYDSTNLNIESFFLIGSGSYINQLPEKFNEYYKTPCIRVDPFRNIEISENYIGINEEDLVIKSSLFCTAVGSALNELTSKSEMSPFYSKKSSASSLNSVNPDPIIIGATAVLFSLLFFIGSIFATKTYLNKKELNKLNASIAILNKDIQIYSKQQLEFVRQENIKRMANQMQSSKVIWSDIFNELSSITPKNVWLTQLNMQFQSGDINYKLIGRTTEQRLTANYFSLLENSKYFSNISISYSKVLPDFHPDMFEFEFKTQNLSEIPVASLKKGGK